MLNMIIYAWTKNKKIKIKTVQCARGVHRLHVQPRTLPRDTRDSTHHACVHEAGTGPWARRCLGPGKRWLRGLCALLLLSHRSPSPLACAHSWRPATLQARRQASGTRSTRNRTPGPAHGDYLSLRWPGLDVQGVKMGEWYIKSGDILRKNA